MELGMVCRNCGEENEEGLEICAFCGEDLQADIESSDSNNIKQLKVEKETQESVWKRSTGGDEKIVFAIIGFGLIFIVVITIASYSLLKNLLSSTSDLWKEKPTSITTIQATEIYQPSDELEKLFYGIRLETVYRPFQSIGILTLDNLQQEIIVADPNGLLPMMMSPEAGQSFISPDRESLAISSGYDQSKILIFRAGDLEPFYQIEGYPALGQFYSFSPDGKYFSFPSRDLQTSEFVLNILDLKLGGIYQQTGLIYGIFLPSSDQAIGFRLSPTEEKVISLEQIDFLHNQTTPLLDLDLSLDDITYIPPFLSYDGSQVFYVHGDTLRSFSLQDGENTFIYNFETLYDARAFCLYHSDKVAIIDGLDPDVANLYLYNLQNDHLTKIDRRVSTTVFHFDQRSFANVPSVALSPDGMRIAYAVGQIGEMELRIAELDGGEIITLSDKVHFISFKFSPDNKKIAYLEFVDSSEYGDLYVTDIHGEDRRLLENDVISFAFKANGSSIVYSKFEYPEQDVSQSSVYVIGVDGEGKEHLMDQDGAFVFIHAP
jgi:Tol biopolymer transport system component